MIALSLFIISIGVTEKLHSVLVLKQAKASLSKVIFAAQRQPSQPGWSIFSISFASCFKLDLGLALRLRLPFASDSRCLLAALYDLRPSHDTITFVKKTNAIAEEQVNRILVSWIGHTDLKAMSATVPVSQSKAVRKIVGDAVDPKVATTAAAIQRRWAAREVHAGRHQPTAQKTRRRDLPGQIHFCRYNSVYAAIALAWKCPRTF